MKKLSVLLVLILSLFLFCGVAEAANNLYSASLEGEISLHISPDEDSFVITKIPACSKLKLIRTERTWGLVSFKNKAGWINLSFTRENYSKAAEATGNDLAKSVRVNAKDGKAILYNIPSEDTLLGSSEKHVVPNQTILEITRQTPSGWGLVSMHGKYAWVKMDDVEAFDTQNDSDKYGIYYVYTLSEKGEGVNMFVNEYGENLCAVIPDCIKLTVQDTKGDYAHVSYDGTSGYINLKYTTQSLSNAQSNAGEKVNAEYIITPPEEEEEVNVYSVPSQEEKDGPSIVGTVKRDESVYVLRATINGWYLINCNGQLGWIPPQSASISEVINENENITVYETVQEAFVVSPDGKGLKVYAEPYSKKEHASVLETAQIRIIAEKDSYKYIYSDYAAGWINDFGQVATYEEAIEMYPDKSRVIFITNRETALMSLPTKSITGGSEELLTIPEGKFLEVIRTVTTGKTKWVLAKIDEQYGWINKAHLKEEGSVPILILLLILIVVGAIAVIVLIILLIKKIVKNIKKKKEKEIDENEKSVHNEDSGTREKSPDVSGK